MPCTNVYTSRYLYITTGMDYGKNYVGICILAVYNLHIIIIYARDECCLVCFEAARDEESFIIIYSKLFFFYRMKIKEMVNVRKCRRRIEHKIYRGKHSVLL